MSLQKTPVLLVGNGPMAKEYARVFRDGLRAPFAVCGRNKKNISDFAAQEGALAALTVDEARTKLGEFRYVVLCTAADSLETLLERLLRSGAKSILVEKPVALSMASIDKLSGLAVELGAKVKVALNRRYYPSIQKLKSILKEDSALSALFEFTELSASIASDSRPAVTKSRWGLVNPIHVIDAVTFLLGSMTNLQSQIHGSNRLDWHPSGALFSGTADIGGVPTVYTSNWLSPGRWNIEVMTSKGRYKLSPMERLQVMRPGSFEWSDYPLDVSSPFKPGLFELLTAFESFLLQPKTTPIELPSLGEVRSTIHNVYQIFGYSD